MGDNKSIAWKIMQEIEAIASDRLMRGEERQLTPIEAEEINTILLRMAVDAKQLSTILQRGRERFAAEVDAIERKARR